MTTRFDTLASRLKSDVDTMNDPAKTRANEHLEDLTAEHATTVQNLATARDDLQTRVEELERALAEKESELENLEEPNDDANEGNETAKEPSRDNVTRYLLGAVLIVLLLMVAFFAGMFVLGGWPTSRDRDIQQTTEELTEEDGSTDWLED